MRTFEWKDYSWAENRGPSTTAHYFTDADLAESIFKGPAVKINGLTVTETATKLSSMNALWGLITNIRHGMVTK